MVMGTRCVRFLSEVNKLSVCECREKIDQLEYNGEHISYRRRARKVIHAHHFPFGQLSSFRLQASPLWLIHAEHERRARSVPYRLAPSVLMTSNNIRFFYVFVSHHSFLSTLELSVLSARPAQRCSRLFYLLLALFLLLFLCPPHYLR